MDLSVGELEARLDEVIARARAGEVVTVTDEGEPVVRLVAVDDAQATLQRLEAAGTIATASRSDRPLALRQDRPRPRQPVADRVSEQRR